LLEGDNKRQRIVAAWALARQDKEPAQRFLDRAADDPDEQVGKAALNPPSWLQKPSTELPDYGPELIQ
jgi:hypothetical protein